MGARAIVEIRFGPMQGVKALIARGARLRVGRTSTSSFVVPHDPLMSAQHFELSWDGERCFLKDLGSAKGTRLAGEAVQEAEVEHGGWIRAGGTDFMVHFEGRIAARKVGEDEAWRVRINAAERALTVLKDEATKGKLYAVLDAARDDRILQLLKQNVEGYRSLYEGVEGETLAEVAPYLVGPMAQDSALLDALVREGWGKRWGIYCVSRENFREVRKHWRRFLMVEEEETGERLYFRFYDPQVMRAFGATCTERHRAQLTMQMDQIWLEGIEADQCVALVSNNGHAR